MITATAADLNAWLGEVPAEPARLLERAAEIIYDATSGNQTTATADQIAIIKKAICAQVEFWLEVGEESDIRGPEAPVSAGGVSISGDQPELAPRARRLLSSNGLLGIRVKMGATSYEPMWWT